jgi:tetratricopeptide (TPR) repeat protein
VNLRSGDVKGTAICYNDLGNVYKAEKSYNQALEYCLKALELFEKASDLRYIIDTKLNIGQILMFLGDMAKAEKYI